MKGPIQENTDTLRKEMFHMVICWPERYLPRKIRKKRADTLGADFHSGTYL
ncbi:hypothetical protein C823_002947 [Eubacterium plexicaudatum ASF492]|uniref:Uncharacterized protein n=1 Tax=Eubacterium plexicaudatum ASF492 TaxID=1235802 RepID=N2AC42_9FIRM|nr:hypothetical protein C823_002947 [Eubacterium plexicaudatum ASF492]